MTEQNSWNKIDCDMAAEIEKLKAENERLKVINKELVEALKQVVADYKILANRKPNNRLLQYRLDQAQIALSHAEGKEA